jgi:hypothetical protein
LFESADSLDDSTLDDSVEDAAVVGSVGVVAVTAITEAAGWTVVLLEDAALASPAAPRVMPMPARPAYILRLLGNMGVGPFNEAHGVVRLRRSVNDGYVKRTETHAEKLLNFTRWTR